MKEWNYIEPHESGGAYELPLEFSLSRIFAWGCIGIITLTQVFEFGILASFIMGVAVPVDMLIVAWLKEAQRKEILEYYAAIVEPIFESQRSEDDDQVLQRATRHRELLVLSENEMFAKGLIKIHKIYFRDPLYDRCESWEEYETRRQDYIRDVTRDWSRKIAPKDEKWREQYFHRQQMA